MSDKQEFLDILITKGKPFIAAEKYLQLYLYLASYLIGKKSSLLTYFRECFHDIGMTDEDLEIISDDYTRYAIVKSDMHPFTGEEVTMLQSLRNYNTLEKVWLFEGLPKDHFIIFYDNEEDAQHVIDQELKDQNVRIASFKCRRKENFLMKIDDKSYILMRTRKQAR